MNRLLSLYNSACSQLARLDPLLPLLARLLFAAVLLGYFWASARTKLGDGVAGLVSPSTGAYAQIFPKATEAVTYDTSQLSLLHHVVVLAGTWAEFLLPLMLVLGLLTRLAALGMIGFVTVQSLTDIFGHGGATDPAVLGSWFDRMADSAILDQRAMWMLLLAILAIKGAGALSLDRLLLRNAP